MDGRVWMYRVLASDRRVPLWSLRHIRGIAFHTHLYTRLVAGQESDDFERWLDREFEAPAEDAIEKATSDLPLTRDDWRILVRFLAAQDVRTPAWFEEQSERWEKSIPELLENTLSSSVKALEEAAASGTPVDERTGAESEGLPIQILTERVPGADTGRVGIKFLIGRELWQWSMRRALEHTVDALHRHRWTILRPPRGVSWLTSDSPVVRLNMTDRSQYDFKGGWGRKGSDIFLPLGPQHLMHTQIGERPPPRGKRLSHDQADLVRRMIAERAHRLIFAEEADAHVHVLRPRVEDPELFRRDREQWQTWHAEQTAAENQLRESGAKDGDGDHVASV